jgi:hypothetical protein
MPPEPGGGRPVLGKVVLAAIAFLVTAALIVPRTRVGQRFIFGGPGPVPGHLPPPSPGTVAAAPSLKIAFIGDSGARASFQRVLALIQGERADAIVHMGDATYDGDTAQNFWGAVDRVMGHDYPYFLAQGNHDMANWPALAEHGLEHLRASGAISDATSLVDPRFSLTFRGASLVFVGASVTDADPGRIIERFSHDDHVWKICVWHKNQTAMQVGGKGDGTGWGVYESCRQMGAFIVTGHEHSYHRTRTLSSLIEQRVDPGCGDAKRLCVHPGAVPVFVSGLGGESIRVQQRCLPATYPYGCNGEWAFLYTADQQARFGALFMIFGEDNPRKARGYFKNVDGQVVDEFTMTAE